MVGCAPRSQDDDRLTHHSHIIETGMTGCFANIHNAMNAKLLSCLARIDRTRLLK
jgi:hypothetical protein